MFEMYLKFYLGTHEKNQKHFYENIKLNIFNVHISDFFFLKNVFSFASIFYMMNFKNFLTDSRNLPRL